MEEQYTQFIIALSLHGTPTAQMEREQSALLQAEPDGQTAVRFMPLICPLSEAEDRAAALSLLDRYGNLLNGTKLTIHPPETKDEWLFRPVSAERPPDGLYARPHLLPSVFPPLPPEPAFPYAWLRHGGISGSTVPYGEFSAAVYNIGVWNFTCTASGTENFCASWTKEKQMWIRAR